MGKLEGVAESEGCVTTAGVVSFGSGDKVFCRDVPPLHPETIGRTIVASQRSKKDL